MKSEREIIMPENETTTESTETVDEEKEVVQLPTDHPLVKTLEEQKKLIKELRELTGAPGDLMKIREKAKKFDDFEEANKTEQQKLIDRAEKAEKALAERDAKETAQKLAKEIAEQRSEGLVTAIPASALRGTTKEELEAHADELAALIPKKEAAPSADGQGSGGKPIGDGDMSPEDIVAAATGR